MYAKTLLLLVAAAIVAYTLTRPREGMCAATKTLTASSIKIACEGQKGVYDEKTNTCSCPEGTA
jgi:hypothetical protein